MTYHPLVRDSVLDKPYQPLVVYGIQITSNVGVQHPAYRFRHDPRKERIQGIMGIAPRPEPLRKSEKVPLIDRIHHLRRRSLGHLVFQYGHPQRPLPSIGFGNVGSPDGLCSICSPLQPPGEIPKVLLQVLPGVPPCLSVNSRSGSPLQAEVRLPKTVHLIDMVPEPCKPQLLIPACCLPYPLQRTLQARRLNVGPSPWPYLWFPTSCPFRVLQIDPSPGPEPGACFARTDSPRSGPFPPPSPPAGFSPAFVQRSLRYLWACPTSHDRSSPSCSFRIHGASPRAIAQEQAWDLPAPVQKASVRARGLRPRRASPSLAIAEGTVLPSEFIDTVGAPKQAHLSRLNTRPALSPVNASPAPSRSPAHDSGPMRFANPSSYGTLIHYSLPVFFYRRTNNEGKFSSFLHGTSYNASVKRKVKIE